MSIAEFDLIERYFARNKPANPLTQLGIGDDCALLNVPCDSQLSVTTDTMVEGVHFFAGADPMQLGHKLLAVNLSDLASMGAVPIAVTLALSLPEVDENWLHHFAQGFMQLARRYEVDLIGGDTTAGPLTLTVQALGIVPRGTALLRSGAQSGDLIYVTGDIGNAGLGLKISQGYLCAEPADALRSLHMPEPRVREGQSIRGIAHACIDISDGLTADLGHILEQSRVGACLVWENIPLSASVKHYICDTGDWQMPLVSGDDYELCFTVSKAYSHAHKLPGICIGRIEQELGLRIVREGNVSMLKAKGFEHFS